MNYNNKDIRRQDRLLEKEAAVTLLQTGEYGVLSMVETQENHICGYGIPLNFVWNGENAVYFHCAPEGHKINCLEANPHVSFCIVGKTCVIPNQFTTNYKSIIIRGTVQDNLAIEERKLALELLVGKYSPEHKEQGMKYSEKSFDRTRIIRLDIEQISGKSKLRRS